MNNMSNQIWMNYQNTIQQAEALERLAAELRRMSEQKISDSIRQIEASWMGETGELYCKRGNRLNAIIYQRSKTLSDTAGILRTSAENMYRAERLSQSLIATLAD